MNFSCIANNVAASSVAESDWQTIRHRLTNSCVRVQLTMFARLLFGMTAALVLSNLVWFLPYYKRMAELGG